MILHGEKSTQVEFYPDKIPSGQVGYLPGKNSTWVDFKYLVTPLITFDEYQNKEGTKLSIEIAK